MKNNIPWTLIVDYFNNRITETDLQRLQVWKSEAANEVLFQDILNLWEIIHKRASSYNPDKQRNWLILADRLQQNNKNMEVAPALIVRNKLYRYAGIACILILITLIGTFYAGREFGTEKPKELVYATYGGKSKIILPDGSEVWLHGNTTLKYPSKFDKSYRKVYLSGEAFFKVAKNPKAPFFVLTEELETRVLGTEFNVLAYPEAEEIHVTLEKGAVSVKSALKEEMLHVGDEAIYNKQSKELKVISNARAQSVSIWTKEKIYFDKQPLRQITETLSIWYGVEITIDSLAAEKYTFTFTLRNEPLEEILRLMGRISPIHYEFDEDNKLTITEKKLKSNPLKQHAYELN